MLAPRVVLGGARLGEVQSASPEECAERCREDAECSWFNACGAPQVGVGAAVVRGCRRWPPPSPPFRMAAALVTCPVHAGLRRGRGAATGLPAVQPAGCQRQRGASGPEQGRRRGDHGRQEHGRDSSSHTSLNLLPAKADNDGSLRSRMQVSRCGTGPAPSQALPACPARASAAVTTPALAPCCPCSAHSGNRASMHCTCNDSQRHTSAIFPCLGCFPL